MSRTHCVQDTCYCMAYSFPHRRSSGQCSGDLYFCTSCGEGCEVVEVDFGIGPYEYFGAPGTHHDYAIVSRCCEAEARDSLTNQPVEELP